MPFGPSDDEEFYDEIHPVINLAYVKHEITRAKVLMETPRGVRGSCEVTRILTDDGTYDYLSGTQFLFIRIEDGSIHAVEERYDEDT